MSKFVKIGFFVREPELPKAEDNLWQELKIKKKIQD